MKVAVFILSGILFWHSNSDKERMLEYSGSQVLTTYQIDEKFIGKYAGAKSGFMLLNDDGTGVYRYDYAKLSSGCQGEEIHFNWGFILDDNSEVVRFEREYGYSYPIIYNCSGENAFQDCTKRSMIDYLLEYKDGTITISSSDDWVKLKD